MNRLCFVLRPAELYPRLRKAESAHVSRRQRCEAKFTRPEEKAVILYLQDIILGTEIRSDPLRGNTPDLADMHVNPSSRQPRLSFPSICP